MPKGDQNDRKEGEMRKNCFLLLIAALFTTCLSCGSQTTSMPDAGVTILSPKANDVVQGGSPYDIQWKAEVPESDFGAMVTVQFSKDGGGAWENLAENVPNSGKYTWSAPKPAAQAKVRVFSQYRPKYRGTSEAFSIK